MKILNEYSVMDTTQNASHHQSVLNSLPLGIFTVDTDWRITFVNRQAEKVTGFKKTDAVGCKCYEIFRAELCYGGCHLKQAIKTGRNIVQVRNRILTKSNREVPVSITAAVLRDGRGRVLGGVGSFLDDSVRVALEKKIKESYTFGDIIGKDEKIARLFDILPVVAESDASILVVGETGTGKDMFARATHNMSHRKGGPFVKVNCAAVPDNLLESELFGYRQGAFTDAKRDKPGRFQLAEGGTIFLDEIGDLSQNLQAKLLQVLDEKEFYPLGSRQPAKVDVKVVASTNRNLPEMVQEGTFRADLYYRLRVIELEIPPLRERASDIPLLIDHFIAEIGSSLGKEISGVRTDAMKVLLNYAYPGNVRQLKNMIEHAVILCQQGDICKDHLPEYVFDAHANKAPPSAALPHFHGAPTQLLQAKEREALFEALATHGWNIQKTSKSLHINRTTLWRKMKKHGLSSRQTPATAV
ncbi:MAG: sigma 54-interacting transcriptional regulator [Thermodesulfobacteriota bacterium]|nr:sigma 54-interacting transcriptional regulator [Thermodesulfobacteriota bacterium]